MIDRQHARAIRKAIAIVTNLDPSEKPNSGLIKAWVYEQPEIEPDNRQCVLDTLFQLCEERQARISEAA